MKNFKFLLTSIFICSLSGGFAAEENELAPSQEEQQVELLLKDGKDLTQNEYYSEAIAIYESLIQQYPDNADYYFFLGLVYKKAGCFTEAIDIYSQGLSLKPDYLELKNALAYAYMYRGMHTENVWPHYSWFLQYPYLFYIVPEEILYRLNECDIQASRSLFEEVIAESPGNSSAMTGLGRIEALHDNKNAAESYYCAALGTLENEDTTLYYYYAALLSQEGRNYSSKCMYEKVLEIDPCDEYARRDYNDVLWKIGPSYEITGFYSQENEQSYINETDKEWTARLYDYGGYATWDYSLCDRLNVHIGVTDEFIRLKNLVTHRDIYSLNVQRANVGFSFNNTPYTYILGGIGVSLFDQHMSSTYKTRFGWYFQPYLSFNYQRKEQRFFLETTADAPIVARDFDDNRAALIDRQFLRGYYEYNFGNRTLIGTTASNVWYINRIKNNQQQIASAWFQWGPKCLYEYLVFRYQYIYGRFNRTTSDYYTYRFQSTHWLNTTLSKGWLDNRLVTEAGYGHAWQRGYEQGQIIAVVPIGEFRIINREINACYINVEYDPDASLRFSLKGTYTKDSFNYTTASAAAKFEWKF